MAIVATKTKDDDNEFLLAKSKTKERNMKWQNTQKQIEFHKLNTDCAKRRVQFQRQNKTRKKNNCWIGEHAHTEFERKEATTMAAFAKKKKKIWKTTCHFLSVYSLEREFCVSVWHRPRRRTANSSNYSFFFVRSSFWFIRNMIDFVR